MRKLFILVVLLAMVLGSCATLQHVRQHETELNIHDIFFTETEPETYDDCVKIDTESFNYGDTPCLVVRFGGLQPNEENIVYWGVAADVFHNGEPVGAIGPTYFNGDLDELPRDKYMARIPLHMAANVPPGLYKFTIHILDGMTYDMVSVSIEFSLLPRTVSVDSMQLWDELVGHGPQKPF